jgi:hypothetical protein
MSSKGYFDVRRSGGS